MLSIILDPAHGKETSGKRSPDESHREYKWSREMLTNVASNLLLKKQEIDIYFPYVQLEREINRIERVRHYNELTLFTDNALVISLHNNAYGSNWNNVRGHEVWTSKGQDNSDRYAASWFDYFKNLYPDQKFRSSKWEDGDPDKEANFTILAGSKKTIPIYSSILIEWGFMTNKQDVEMLKNREANKLFEENLTNWIISIL